MLPTPDHLLALYVFGNASLEDLLHQLPRGKCKVDLIYLLAILRSRSDFAFFRSSWTSPFHHDHSKIIEWLHSGISYLLQHSWTKPIRLPWAYVNILYWRTWCFQIPDFPDFGLDGLGYLKVSFTGEDWGKQGIDNLGLLCIICRHFSWHIQ